MASPALYEDTDIIDVYFPNNTEYTNYKLYNNLN